MYCKYNITKCFYKLDQPITQAICSTKTIKLTLSLNTSLRVFPNNAPVHITKYHVKRPNDLAP